jgi:hypothetical protein
VIDINPLDFSGRGADGLHRDRVVAQLREDAVGGRSKFGVRILDREATDRHIGRHGLRGLSGLRGRRELRRRLRRADRRQRQAQQPGRKGAAVASMHALPRRPSYPRWIQADFVCV